MKERVQAQPSTSRFRNGGSAGFSSLDLMVVVAFVLVGFVFLLSFLAKTCTATPQTRCINNLKQIGLSFRIFSMDHAGEMPMQRSTNLGGSLEFAAEAYRHFQAVSSELSTPKVLFCRNDPKAREAASFHSFGSSNLSYFVSLDANEQFPRMFLAGDRTLSLDGLSPRAATVLLRPNSVAEWAPNSHIRSRYRLTKRVEWGSVACGNILVADGSARSLSVGELRDAANRSGARTNRLVFP